eukprot:365033-Chlamydomonas_euryale.AAC.8
MQGAHAPLGAPALHCEPARERRAASKSALSSARRMPHTCVNSPLPCMGPCFHLLLRPLNTHSHLPAHAPASERPIQDEDRFKTLTHGHAMPPCQTRVDEKQERASIFPSPLSLDLPLTPVPRSSPHPCPSRTASASVCPGCPPGGRGRQAGGRPAERRAVGGVRRAGGCAAAPQRRARQAQGGCGAGSRVLARLKVRVGPAVVYLPG